jgi:ABC-type multidrug transport system fused ATPase/permease subunit
MVTTWYCPCSHVDGHKQLYRLFLGPQIIHLILESTTSILNNISFQVAPGEVVALVGPSGGGKTSCFNLLQRFYDPTHGKVLIDDLPLSRYQHKFHHSRMSMVGQEPVLYARSIASNIAYGVEDLVEVGSLEDTSEIEQSSSSSSSSQPTINQGKLIFGRK